MSLHESTWIRRTQVAAVAVVSALATGCGIFGCHLYRQPAGGMEPTVKKGAYVLVKHLPSDAALSASEIVAFRSPDDEGALLIKRVIAVGGQTVEMRKGRLYLDDRSVTEDYVPAACVPDDSTHVALFSSMPELHDFGPLTLSRDELFLMGDNRDHSRDSRAWGAIKRSQVVGRVAHVF